MSNEEYRFYALGNYYLSSIQQGIQAFHVLGEMSMKYPGINQAYNTWIKEDKTLICLNGGNNQDLVTALNLFEDERNTGFPVARFFEDIVSLNGTLTSIGIILPKRIWDAQASYPNGYFYGMEYLDGWEEEICRLIRTKGLAR